MPGVAVALRVAVRSPTAVGRKVTATVQISAGFRVLFEQPETPTGATVYWAELEVTLTTPDSLPPVFSTVKMTSLLAMPTATVPKAETGGLMASWATDTADPLSVALMVPPGSAVT